MLHARGALRLAVRRRDPLVGAMMWAHDAQVHMLVLPAQTANAENHVLTSCGTRVLPGPGVDPVWWTPKMRAWPSRWESQCHDHAGSFRRSTRPRSSS